MGVTNQRSIAWGCVQSFLRHGYRVVLTVQDEKRLAYTQKLVADHPNILDVRVCDVTTDLPRLDDDDNLPEIDALVHAIAYGNLQQSLLETSLDDYLESQHISAYSFLETVRHVQPHLSRDASLVALSYLGSTRAVPGYGIMGPAKASLEALVRGLAWETGIRCNVVSAGPLRTPAARGIPGFGTLRQHVHDAVGRNVTVEQVAETVTWLSSPAASGITGQVIQVDAGYSSIVPVGATSS